MARAGFFSKPSSLLIVSITMVVLAVAVAYYSANTPAKIQESKVSYYDSYLATYYELEPATTDFEKDQLVKVVIKTDKLAESYPEKGITLRFKVENGQIEAVEPAEGYSAIGTCENGDFFMNDEICVDLAHTQDNSVGQNLVKVTVKATGQGTFALKSLPENKYFTGSKFVSADYPTLAMNYVSELPTTGAGDEPTPTPLPEILKNAKVIEIDDSDRLEADGEFPLDVLDLKNAYLATGKVTKYLLENNIIYQVSDACEVIYDASPIRLGETRIIRGRFTKQGRMVDYIKKFGLASSDRNDGAGRIEYVGHTVDYNPYYDSMEWTDAIPQLPPVSPLLKVNSGFKVFISHWHPNDKFEYLRYTANLMLTNPHGTSLNDIDSIGHCMDVQFPLDNNVANADELGMMYDPSQLGEIEGATFVDVNPYGMKIPKWDPSAIVTRKLNVGEDQLLPPSITGKPSKEDAGEAEPSQPGKGSITPTVRPSKPKSITPTVVPDNRDKESGKCGSMDSNGDNKITIIDFLEFVKTMGKKCTPEKNDNYNCGTRDVNGNGEIDNDDFTKFTEIYRKSTNSKTNLTCDELIKLDDKLL